MSVRPIGFYDDDDALTPEELQEIETALRDKRARLLLDAKRRPEPLGDERRSEEGDRAAGEVEAAFEGRLRERSQAMIRKIDKALRRLAAGEYDECEVCGDLISRARLFARPEASLCIPCKEEQEMLERSYLKPRLRNANNDPELFF